PASSVCTLHRPEPSDGPVVSLGPTLLRSRPSMRTGGRMIRRRALTAAACLAAPWPVRTRAQTRARRLGVIYPGVDPGGPPPGAAAAWKRVGWIVGETLLIERRYAAGRVG